MHTYDPLGLLRVLDDLEQFARSSNDHAAIGAVRESRGALEKLVNFPPNKSPTLEEVRKVNQSVTKLMEEIQNKTEAK